MDVCIYTIAIYHTYNNLQTQAELMVPATPGLLGREVEGKPLLSAN